MATLPRPERLTLPLPVAGAAVGGGAVALAFLLMPAGPLERAVLSSGIPAVLAAAEPPLGFTARIALGVVFGGLVAAFAWFALNLTAGERPFDMTFLTDLLRRKGANADAPPRPPLFANRDLGTPFLDVKAPPAPPMERDLPLDLDQPMGAYDPGALPAAPLAAPEPVAPLASAPRPQLIDPGDRFETFELTPVQREPSARPPSLRVPPAGSLRATSLRESGPIRAPQPAAAPGPVVAPETETTVQALLARLERGLSARAEAPAPGGLEGTLGDLRRLATGRS